MKINEEKFIRDLTVMISKMMGSKCEVLYHDWSKGHNHSIKFIENGDVTGRKIGGPANNIILEVIKTGEFSNRFNSLTRTSDGRTLKSSTVYLTDENDQAVGAFCINYDVTDLITQMLYINEIIPSTFIEELSVDSYYAKNVNDLLKHLIEQATLQSGKDPKELTKNERLQFIKYLDEKGAFLISKSSNKICEVLGVSKYTLYSDLGELKEGNNS